MASRDAALIDAIHLPLADVAATEALAGALASRLRAGDTLLLSGPLGAGKTTLARALIRVACGEPALEVPSPTYTLLQEYPSPMGTLTHLDLWRIDPADPEAAEAAIEELGWDDARAGVVLVEWPDRLGRLRPRDALAVTLDPADDAKTDADAETGARRATLAGWPPARLAGLGTARNDAARRAPGAAS